MHNDDDLNIGLDFEANRILIMINGKSFNDARWRASVHDAL